MKRNTIPRNFKRITAKRRATGDIFLIYRDNGLHGVNLTDNRLYYIFADHLRIPEAWQIIWQSL